MWSGVRLSDTPRLSCLPWSLNRLCWQRDDSVELSSQNQQSLEAPGRWSQWWFHPASDQKGGDTLLIMWRELDVPLIGWPHCGNMNKSEEGSFSPPMTVSTNAETLSEDSSPWSQATHPPAGSWTPEAWREDNETRVNTGSGCVKGQRKIISTHPSQFTLCLVLSPSCLRCVQPRQANSVSVNCRNVNTREDHRHDGWDNT